MQTFGQQPHLLALREENMDRSLSLGRPVTVAAAGGCSPRRSGLVAWMAVLLGEGGWRIGWAMDGTSTTRRHCHFVTLLHRHDKGFSDLQADSFPLLAPALDRI